MPPDSALLTAALLLFCGVAAAVHLASILLAWARLRRHEPALSAADHGVTLLRPVCGIENHIEETLAGSFALTWPRHEILFCVAAPDDPVIPLVERLIAAHPDRSARLLVGDDRVSGNPKLNNMVKGWNAAAHDWIAMVDSNVLLPPDYVERLVAQWRDGTGLVSSPAVGIRPQGFAAELEAGFLNTYQARWQLAADQLGLGFAQGKNLFWHHDMLEAAGGIAALGAEMAEDVAATKLVRAASLQVRLVGAPFPQPLGPRRLAEVWRRQVRWARVRRLGFRALFVPEILTGGLFPLAAATALAAGGAIAPALVLAYGLVWYGAEYGLARSAGWPASPRSVPGWLLRDALLPALWISGWTGSSFVWRGNSMAPEPEPRAETGQAADLHRIATH